MNYNLNFQKQEPINLVQILADILVSKIDMVGGIDATGILKDTNTDSIIIDNLLVRFNRNMDYFEISSSSISGQLLEYIKNKKQPWIFKMELNNFKDFTGNLISREYKKVEFNKLILKNNFEFIFDVSNDCQMNAIGIPLADKQKIFFITEKY